MQAGFFNTDSADLDDAQIALACQGDEAACAALYHRFASPVYNLALRMLYRHDLAEDVVQDVFVHVLRKLDQFRGDSPLGGWIRRITVNRTLSLMRSPWYRLRDVLGEPEPQFALLSATAEDPGLGRRLEAALCKLSPVSRAVLWLHDVEGYTHREIAESMGASISFSKSQLARAHNRMRDLMNPPSPVENKTCTPAPNHC